MPQITEITDDMDYIDGVEEGGRDSYKVSFLVIYINSSNMAGVSVKTCKIDAISFNITSISTVTMITQTAKSKF